jgi:subtilase family serine protease
VTKHEKKVFLQLDCVDGPLMPRLRFVVFALLLSSMLCGTVLPAYAADGQYIANNTPAYVSSAKNLGAAEASETIEVSIWLQPHNRAALDDVARDLYDPNSPNYRHWLKSSEIAAQFAPTAAEAKTVQEFFESNNLKIVSVGPNNFYVRAQGTVADVESAFHVQLSNYEVAGQTLRSNTTDPYIEGRAAALVQAVSGLDNGSFQNSVALQRTAPASNSGSVANVADLSRVVSASDPDWFNADCFTGPKTEEHSTLGTFPKAAYKGNGYSSGSLACGYSPSNIYAAYNLNGLYAEGYNGKGQTIVIIESCGSPTIQDDANTFSKKFGLPKLTASNFSIINYPARPSTCAGAYPGINADVEWAHAIAPGAKIDLLVTPSHYLDDVDETTLYAVIYGLGNVISGSYFTPEAFAGETEAEKENLISEIAAVEGIATNFACGEFGSEETPWPVSVPADLPYATGIGGISLALNSDNSIAFQTAWQTHASVLVQGGAIYDPPGAVDTTGYIFGGLGGPSAFFAKPWFQRGVPGKQRQQPDISWLADPYTGGVIVVSEPTQIPPQIWQSFGGTGLATPMFSALWAIANQEAGTALGQATPYLYSMPAALTTDIVPYKSADDVTAVVQESSSVSHNYNAAEALALSDPETFGPFYSAIWDDPGGAENSAWVLSFGQDYFFKARTGWDEATGLGVPRDAKAFADWFAPAASNTK